MKRANFSFACLAAALMIAGSLPAAGEEPGVGAYVPRFYAFQNGMGLGSPEDDARVLKELGYDGVSQVMDQGAALANRVAAYDRVGMSVLSVYLNVNDQPIAAEVVEPLRDRDALIELTIRKITPQTVEAVRQTAEMAAALNIKVALYPHSGFAVATMPQAMDLIAKVDHPNLGVMFNLCHFLKSENAEELEKVLQEAGPRLFAVSTAGADLDGTDWGELIQPLGQGNFPQDRLLKALEQMDFRGPVGLQCFGVPGDRRTNLENSMAAWKRFTEDLMAVPVVAQVQDAGQPKKRAEAEKYNTSVPQPTLTGIRYGAHPRHILDFWQATSDKPTPLVFVIHGGGWRNGSKERLNRFVDTAALLKEGISVVAINYRLMRHAEGVEPPVKAPLHDAARALQFVRSKAEEWNIDTDRIGAAGGSAGACSSLWLLYHDDLADPESSDPVARESTRLTCAAVTNPQTTLDPQQMKEWTPNSHYGGHAFGIVGFDQFLAERENILPWIQEYSPFELVSADDPPVYLYYKGPAPSIGKPQKDPTHTANFGVKLQERCVGLGVKCELVYRDAPNVRYRNSTDYLIAELKAPSGESLK